MIIESFVAKGLGHSSYLITSEEGSSAVVIDPRRDIAAYLEAAERLGVQITRIFETHNHNDFVSGSCELANATGAEICAAAASGIQYEFIPLHEDQHIVVGDVDFEVIDTPGHTPAHISYIARHGGKEALFSGGSLLVGAAGRTDLLGSALTAPLTRLLYNTIQHKLARLSDQMLLYPTHGQGSFCASGTIGQTRSSTVGWERRHNPAMLPSGEEEFLQRHLAGLGSYPSYYSHMREINIKGPRILSRLPDPHPLSVERASELLSQGHLVVDGRSPLDFGTLHIQGSYNVALSDQFASWVGWITPFNAPLLMVLSREAEDWHEASIQLLRIGYEQLAGYLAGGVAAWQFAGLPIETIKSMPAEQLAEHLVARPDTFLLDVRNTAEWEQYHLPEAHHMEAGTLSQHLDELPRDRPIVTVCAGGFRASIASSLLQRAGFTQVQTAIFGLGRHDH